MLNQSDSLLTTSDEVVHSFQNTDIVITDAEHSVPSSFRSGKTTKSRKEASGFTTGSEANVKSLRGNSSCANQFAALGLLLWIGVRIWGSQRIQMIISSQTLQLHLPIDFFGIDL